MNAHSISRLLALTLLVVTGCDSATEEPPAAQQPSSGTLPTVTESSNSIGMQFVSLPGGTFTMGSNSGDPRDADETPHDVTLTQPFYMGVHEVTQTQYEQVMGSNPSKFKGRSNPVEKVSWDDAVSFCQKLSSLRDEQAAGRVYRLPTEAEWEYACRAGTATEYSFGDDASALSTYGWFDANLSSSMKGMSSHPVGEKRANGWGLYDMHGNVWEWCSDWFGKYPNGSVTDPIGPASGSSRVLRGGGWNRNASHCRSARRRDFTPDSRYIFLGFRVVMSPSAAGGE